jgi:hypothetical protein
MSRIKPFGYPIPADDLARFLDPDGGRPLAWEGWTYYVTPWWVLRTTQATPAIDAEKCPVGEQTLAKFAEFDSLDAKKWHALDTIAPLVNKFTSRIWERTQFRHHLQKYPLCLIGSQITTRGILSLCTQLPRAEIYSGPRSMIPVRFRSGQMLLRSVPREWDDRISLTFFQPKEHRI